MLFISLAVCLKFSFKLVTFSESYARKQKWLFSSEHSISLHLKNSLSSSFDGHSHFWLSACFDANKWYVCLKQLRSPALPDVKTTCS